MPLAHGHSRETIGRNIAEMAHAGHPQKQAVAAALRIARETRADGGRGMAPPIPGPNDRIGPEREHVGPIRSHVAGRTDHLPMHVPSGAYVLPADIVSAMGEGNTSAGFRVAKSVFSQPFYGDAVPGGRPYRQGPEPYGQPEPRAAGGRAPPVPIVAAGGEFVIHPRDVMRLGRGSLEDGHSTLDEFVKRMRAKTVRTLKNLPGPKKD